jgi:hypothetical protein
VRLTDGLVKGDFPADELEVPAKPEA